MKNFLIFSMKMGATAFLLAILSLLGNAVSAQDTVYPFHATDKKVIILQGSKYWDWSSDLKDNLGSMQAQRPYIDGVAFHIGSTYGQPLWAFNNEVWTEKSMRFDDLTVISKKWTTLKDNFILVCGHAHNTDPDFFNDELWSQIIKNTELLGKAVKTAGCKGIMFDPEFYSEKVTYSPWWYSKGGEFTPPYVSQGKTFAEVQAKARQRGKAYVQALQVNMPKMTILTTFLYSYVWNYCYYDISKLPASHYSLLAAFADGMVEALNPGSVIIDGNESSYYIDETRKYFENSDQGDYDYNRLDAPRILCDPLLLKKYNVQGQIAMAPYLDLYYNRYSPKPYSTPEYESKWMTHNIYNSLLTTDKYVWIYIERMDFWKNINSPPAADVYKDIKTAIDKFRKGEPLGYDMYKPIAQFKYQAEIPATFITSPTIQLSVSKNKLPGNTTITATMTPDTSIAKVEFFANSLKIGEDATAPYSIQKWFLNVDYTLLARAFKKGGQHTTSAPVILKKN